MGLAPSVQAFFDRVAPSVSSADFLRIQAAWHVAFGAHAGQLRQSGEPYVTHPLAVAEILLDLLEPDADALCAALLHDVVEDSDTSLSSIREQFGPAVALVVDGVSKLDQVRTSGAASAKEETLRKLVAAGGRDWRVFAVKLCDRLHNMRTLGATSSEKRRRVARETHAVFFPLARYVGFQRIATELEALSLKWMHPWRWGVIEKWARYRALFDARRLMPFVSSLPGEFSALLSRGVVDGSDAVLIRCHAQLLDDRASRALFSVPSVLIRCASIDEAYQCIGALHAQFVFVPASFACDASEGTVSTKVLLGRRGPVAEFAFVFPRLARGSWVRTLGESSDDFAAVADVLDHPGDFTRVLRDLVVEKSISVFSPKGQRLSLPRHASGLDFAFAIHTDLGLRAKHIRVNGVMHKPNIELSSGDIVEVIAGEEIVARPEWEAILRSPRSRAKLRQWVRDASRRNSTILGKRLLADAMGITGDGAAVLQIEPSVLSDYFGTATMEDLWQLIGSGRLSAFAVASRLRGFGADQLIRVTSDHDEKSRLILDGRSVDGIQYCDHCHPIPGDAVVAVSSPSGAMIHRYECPKRLASRAGGDSFMPVWADKITEALPGDLIVLAHDRRGLLADCARTISDAGLNVVAVKTRSTRGTMGSTASLEFTVLIQARSRLERCFASLRKVPSVIAASRAEVAAA